MAALPAWAVAAAVGIGAAGAGALLTPKPKQIAPTPQPTRNEARVRAEQNDLLARRTGTNANRRTGYGGSEAFTGPKKSLLGR